MKQDELKKAIADGIFDAFFRMLFCYAVGMLVVAVWSFLYGFMKGLLG